MKKVLSLLLVLGLCFGLAGCGGSSKPDDMTDESYNAAKEVLDKIDKDEAADSIRSTMDGFEGDGVGDIKVRERAKQITSSLYISESSVQEARDNLAEVLEN